MGSHICDQLLGLGYRVRGISRNKHRSAWLVNLLQERHRNGRFEIVEVPDFSADGAFDAAVEGARGVVHTAADTSLDLNPHKVVPKMVSAALGIARAAAEIPSCTRFVFTSSSSAVADPAPGVIRELTRDTYNEETVVAAFSPSLRQDIVGGHTVYAAGKVKTEQALWEWYRKENPHFVMNSVLPSPCFGEVLDPTHQGFSAASGVLKMLFDGSASEAVVKSFESQWFCDVQDVAALHVGALLLTEVKSERLFAFAGGFTVNDFLRIFRNLEPGRKFPEYVQDVRPDMTKVPNERATEVLRLVGLPGWKGLEDCLRPLARQFAAASEQHAH
ncbi:aldehyde reductase ii [Colletotrichum sojae]|uniref:Aldehyde reductase ii n=1 Tax=Colletotrichum sojae TaxID=2175907 RepID=A0A8H6MP25_9PEZI|nr:aldehyde reductase ii [Colletotrichum sojae]